jgi:hypothetical protein
MADIFDVLIGFWKRHGVDPAAERATAEEIEEWERRYKVVLPVDLRDYVMRINGVLRGETLEFDHEGISFLPLSAMCPETEWAGPAGARPNMFVFADFLVRCHWWCAAIDDRPQPHTRIFIGGGSPKTNRMVANSLAEFFDLYRNDHMRIYPQ